jgi:hypothetical protein
MEAFANPVQLMNIREKSGKKMRVQRIRKRLTKPAKRGRQW